MRSIPSSVTAAATVLSSSPLPSSLPSSLSSVAVDVVTVTESSIGHTTQHDVDSSEDSIDSVVMIGRTVRADVKVVNTSNSSSSGSNGTIVVDKLTSLLKGDLHLKQQVSIVNGGEITIDKGMKMKPIPSSPIASLSDSNDSLQASSDPSDDHDDDDDDDEDHEDHDIDESSDNDEVESYHNKNNNHHHDDDDGNKKDRTSINNTIHKNSSSMQTVDITKSSGNKKGPKIKNYARKRASKQHQQQQQQQSRFITFYRYVERMIVQSLIFRQVKRRLQVLSKYIRVLFVTVMTRNTKRESLLFAILYSVSIVILMHVLSKLASTITTLYISHYSTIHHDGTIVINTSAVVNRTTDHYSSIMNILRPITSSTRSSSSSATISTSSSSNIDASAYQTTVVVPTHWVRDGESISFGDFTHLNHDLNNIHTLDRVTNILPTAALKDRVVERYQWTRDGENGLWMLRLICLFSTHHHNHHHLSSCSS